MTDLTNYLLGVDIALLVAGFAYAAWADFREREVSDALWQVLGVVGFLIGFAIIAPGGVIPLVLWLVVGLFVIQHLFAWDLRLGRFGERYADLVELAVYVAVVAVVGVAIARVGVGADGVPVPVIAVLVSVLFARGLFEAGILYGGADAKALMIAGLLVPMFPNPFLAPPASIAPVTAILPFAVNVLMNSALFSIAVPVIIAVRNVRAREFRGVSGFLGYTIAVDDLPRKYVWVRNPMFGQGRAEEESIETSEDDRLRRVEIARDLKAKGVARVWVTPQIPFLVLMAFGVLGALVAGNILFDLIFRL
ncbi:MAG: A24 family peptidase C-terminal domain-containing protein [Candidatus Lutacidiplasmatales archaeon]